MKLVIKPTYDKYEECLYCQSKQDLYIISRDTQGLVITMCKKCIDKLAKLVL